VVELVTAEVEIDGHVNAVRSLDEVAAREVARTDAARAPVAGPV